MEAYAAYSGWSIVWSGGIWRILVRYPGPSEALHLRYFMKHI